MALMFTIPGVPVAKGRARAFMRRGKIAHITPEKTVNYENLVKIQASQAMGKLSLFEGPVHLAITLYMPIPKSWSKKKQDAALADQIRPTSKPDSSNIAKAIEDGMNGIVWNDDSQVTDLSVMKRYGTTPKAIVVVRSAIELGGGA